LAGIRSSTLAVARPCRGLGLLVVSLADSLWHRNRVLAEGALEHPFVQGIASES
jgi:hypothetical protein